MNLNKRIAFKLEQRKQDDTFRSLLSSETGVDFWSNDYLGYARIPFLSTQTTGGSTGSRLISGNSSFTEQVENELADFFREEAALLFNSGYDANLGLLSCLPQKNDVILYDEHIHASMRDGIRLSFAKSYGFQHNSLEDLEKKLTIEPNDGGVRFVCVESLYSMGGGIASLFKIVELCEKYDAHLIVDEAHSGGIYGENGEGISTTLDIQNRIFARIFTFGKAFGCHGAVVVGSNQLREYLINFSRSFIYTTALPKSSVAHIRESIRQKDFLENRKQLFQNIHYFRNLLSEHKINSISEVNSPIQMIRIGNASQTKERASFLRKKGFLVKAIVSPTVKQGEEAIRVCLHSFNTKEEISELVKGIGSVC